jgi:predicted enzyme related to lactoylglutathione lyase
MAETKTAVANKPVWVDLGTSDPAGARDFYSKLFGWKIEVNPDPQYGGYAMGEVNGKSVAGIGPKMSEQQPTAWSLYIGTDDAQATAKKVEQAGGKVIAQPFDVGPQGTMATFQDPIGAFISIWQPKAMSGDFPTGQANTFGWAELDGKSVDKAVPFYQKLFGWTPKQTPMGDGRPPYIEFQIEGNSIAGGMSMGDNAPPQMPNYWMVYFTVADLDKSFKTAISAGAKEMMPPSPYPGGRFAVLSDPQGAVFGLLDLAAQQQTPQQR